LTTGAKFCRLSRGSCEEKWFDTECILLYDNYWLLMVS